MASLSRNCLRRLMLQPYRFMTLSAPDAEDLPEGDFHGISTGLMLLALLSGAGASWLWGGAWMVFDSVGWDQLAMPATITAAVLLLWPLRCAAAALTETIGGPRTSGQAIAGSAIVVLVVIGFYQLDADWNRGETDLGWWLAWARPQCKIYRVLVLMPMWGAWSMLITGQFCRPRAGTDGPAAGLSRGTGAVTAAMWMAAVLTLTMAYHNYLGVGAQLVIPIVTIATAIVGGQVICRRSGGLSRQGLLATNVVTQVAHLLLFLAYQ